MDSKIFISFSHKDFTYLEDLASALEAVATLRDKVWYDRKRIDIGDQFHPEIQQALAESKIGILLVSNPFLTSEYIKTHELPFLLRQAECGALKLGILYVSAVAKAALPVTIEIDGKPRTVNLADTIGVNSPAEPLDKMGSGDRNALYARAADWTARQFASAPPPVREPTGPRHDLAIFIQARHNHWEHQFFLPNQPSAIKPKLDCPEPALVLGYDLDGETLFQLLFGSDPTTVGHLLALAFGKDHPADPTYAPSESGQDGGPNRPVGRLRAALFPVRHLRARHLVLVGSSPGIPDAPGNRRAVGRDLAGRRAGRATRLFYRCPPSG